VTKGVRNKIDTTRKSIEIFAELPSVMQTEIREVTNDHHPTSIRIQCYKQLRSATKYHKQLLRIHRDIRRQSLLSLKEIRKMEGNLSAEEIIGKIARHEIHNENIAIIRALKDPKKPLIPSKQEQYIKQWQTINPVFHTTQRSGLKTIDVPYQDDQSQPTNDPDQASTWQTILDPILIE
jgi:hypothetical protein